MPYRASHVGFVAGGAVRGQGNHARPAKYEDMKRSDRIVGNLAQESKRSRKCRARLEAQGIRVQLLGDKRACACGCALRQFSDPETAESQVGGGAGKNKYHTQYKVAKSCPARRGRVCSLGLFALGTARKTWPIKPCTLYPVHLLLRLDDC